MSRTRAIAWRLALLILISGAFSTVGWAQERTPAAGGEEVTVKGALQCAGMVIPDPKPEDHNYMVIFAVDGSPGIASRVKKIMDEFYPDKGLDADAAVKLQDQFNAQLKFYIAPDSPAKPPGQNTGKGHYCSSARASAVTGILYEKDGRKWIRASRIEDTRLNYPEKMLAPDRPFAMPDKKPLILQVGKNLSLTCIKVPAGRAMLGAPFYMAYRYQEEYPRPVTLTRPFYLSEIPITQDVWEAVMGNNPSTVKNPSMPVQSPPFAEIDRFCQMLSEKTGRKVRLPSAAEWEYAARAGTSNPGFPEKYRDQNSAGNEGWKSVLPVKSRKPNAWGFYDMFSCWWEVTGDRAMYPTRHPEVDPRYPASGRGNRAAMGVVKENWSVSIREFEDEKGLGYTSNKFRILVEAD